MFPAIPAAPPARICCAKQIVGAQQRILRENEARCMPIDRRRSRGNQGRICCAKQFLGTHRGCPNTEFCRKSADEALRMLIDHRWSRGIAKEEIYRTQQKLELLRCTAHRRERMLHELISSLKSSSCCPSDPLKIIGAETAKKLIQISFCQP